MIGELLGGIGLFLLGMTFLTDGLKRLAGKGLRRFLLRFAGNRVSAAATGAVTTALIQSSSATSLIVIGLVAAGLVTLGQGIAMMIGANVGTTATAYIVALIGLKFSLAAVALPLVGLGAIVRIVGRGRIVEAAGIAIGFGLLFAGIDLMQAAMGDVASRLELGGVGAGFWGHLALVAVGAAMTVLMQSSSAAMATTLTAVAAGALDAQQGAYLVIGQNIGTTATALLGAVGTSAAGKRTAAAHLIFNIGAAAPVFVLAPWLLQATTAMAGQDAPLALAYFHTAFNVAGLVIFLPLVGVLAKQLERRVAAGVPALGSRLDPLAGAVPGAAAAGVRATLVDIRNEEIHLIRSRLGSARNPRDFQQRLEAVRATVDQTHTFIGTTQGTGGPMPDIQQLVRALDHLGHIAGDLAEDVPVFGPSRSALLTPYTTRFTRLLDEVASDATPPESDAGFESLVQLRKSLRKTTLDALVAKTPTGVESARSALEALHWMDRIAWHLRRAMDAQRTEGHSDPEAPSGGES